MSDKKNMTAKWFLSLSIKTTKSAEGFLSGYKEWLTTGELSLKTAPIVARIESGETKVEIGLEAIKNIALQHVLTADIEKMEKSADSAGRGTNKPYSSVILQENGEPAMSGDEPIKANFDHIQEAERWTQRRLVDGASDWHGEITWNKMFSDGVPKVTKVTRTEAIYAQRKITKHPYMHQNRVSADMKPRMKVAAKHYQFSRG